MPENLEKTREMRCCRRCKVDIAFAVERHRLSRGQKICHSLAKETALSLEERPHGLKEVVEYSRKERRKNWHEIGIEWARFCWDFEKRKRGKILGF